jgi:hypothetical protein
LSSRFGQGECRVLLGSLEALLSGEGKDEFVNLPKLGAELI